MNTLDQIFELSRQFSGTVGFITKQLDSSSSFSLNEHQVFPTASCIKLPILVELCYQVLNGYKMLDKRILLTPEVQVPGTGVLKDLEPGLSLSLSDLATLAVTVSDNSAANILIDILGMDAINERIQWLGMEKTHLGTKFVFDNPERNTGCPADFCHLLLNLSNRSILDKRSCDWLLNLLERQQYVDYIPRYLPYNRFAIEFGLSQEVRIANKVGMLSGVVNDMAIIHLPKLSYVIVIFSKDSRDKKIHPDNEGALLLARISKIVYDHFTGN